MDLGKALALVAGCVVCNAYAEQPPKLMVKPQSIELSKRPTQSQSREADAETFEFMGIGIGAPLVPECPRERLPYAGSVYDLSGRKSACWAANGMRAGSPTDTRNNESLILLPLDSKRPIGTGSVTATVVDGKVEGLTISTDGFAHAQEIFEQLKQKLGKPSLQDTVQVVSGVGANFSSPRAVWELPGVYIRFNGIVGAVNTGLIIVSTDEERKREEARKLQRAKSF
ncbi:hypothetical protein [Stenotrophomonas sp. ATs4]|uniref:hypothetical protein n=1 Tax=Stenotrophomonas sp. ATs4 TaxID=3402766 RepID=UPI003F7257D5